MLHGIKNELKDKTLGYILTALGLVAGLAWNDAIKGLIEYVLPLGTGTLLLKFIYAGVVTVAIAIFVANINHFFGKNDK